MEYGMNQHNQTSNQGGYSMNPIQWHCIQMKNRLAQMQDSLYTQNTMNPENMHGPAGAGHDAGDEH